MMNERCGRQLLESWMTAALTTTEPALRSFITGLRAEHDAVAAVLTLPWNSGTVEGHVNRFYSVESGLSSGTEEFRLGKPVAD
jgi:transposase